MIILDEFMVHRDVWGTRRMSSRLSTTNEGRDDLHAFADLLGLERWRFCIMPHAHYELTRYQRSNAMRMGAVFVPAARQAAYRMKLCTLETMLNLPALAKASNVIPIRKVM